MDILQNKKHATNRNWHWALDQYVSPKNSIKSYQKYMKVVEYWHGTIKNYRYDGDVSMSGVIVVDAGRSRSTCLGRDVYIHDHT